MNEAIATQKAQEYFQRLKRMFDAIAKKQKERGSYDFYMEAGNRMNKYLRSNEKVYLAALFVKGEPKDWTLFDAPGEDSLAKYIVESYIQMRKDEGALGEGEEAMLRNQITEFQSIQPQTENLQDLPGKPIDEKYLQEIDNKRAVTNEYADIIDENQRTSNYLKFIQKYVPRANQYAIWHKLIGSSQESKWIQKDFPVPYDGKNFIINENIRAQLTCFKMTPTGQQEIQKKKEELEQKYQKFSKESLLYRLLDGEDPYMDIISATKEGEVPKFPPNFDFPSKEDSIEVFITELSQNAEIQKELENIKKQEGVENDKPQETTPEIWRYGLK